MSLALIRPVLTSNWLTGVTYWQSTYLLTWQKVSLVVTGRSDGETDARETDRQELQVLKVNSDLRSQICILYSINKATVLPARWPSVFSCLFAACEQRTRNYPPGYVSLYIIIHSNARAIDNCPVHFLSPFAFAEIVHKLRELKLLMSNTSSFQWRKRQGSCQYNWLWKGSWNSLDSLI